MEESLEPLMEKIKVMGFLIKLDTNGCYPKRLKALVQAGYVDYVAMDVKNTREKYCVTAGAEALDLSKIEESAAFLMEGNVNYEFRTTVVKELHEREDFTAIGTWLKGASLYCLQGFEDSEGVLTKGLHGYSREEMESFRQTLLPYISSVILRGLE